MGRRPVRPAYVKSDALGLRLEFLREPARFNAIPYVVETLQRASEREALERDLLSTDDPVNLIWEQKMTSILFPCSFNDHKTKENKRCKVGSTR